MKKITTLLAIALIFELSCSVVPLTGRKQLNLVSDAEVNQSAAQSYSQLLSDPKTTVINTGADPRRIKTIGSKLSTAVEGYLTANGYGADYKFQWEFNLIKSDEVNAWCMPGGKVAVYSGILPIAQTDAGLATVMAHEIGHAIARHSAERISQQMAVQNVGSAVSAATNNKPQTTQLVISQLYGVGGQLMLLKYSRDQESEADHLGLIFMAMAGYDPNNALAFWKRMEAQNKGGSPPEFLSTHPADATRITDIQNRLPEALKYYKH